LSFELGLLWPEFMKFSGPIFGLPFALEGAAFFLEAIFLGIYLYGWDRVSPHVHFMTGVMVAVSSAMSGALVVCANGWMNTPTGFELREGVAFNIRPLEAMPQSGGTDRSTAYDSGRLRGVGNSGRGTPCMVSLEGSGAPVYIERR